MLYSYLRQISKIRFPIWFCTWCTVSFSCLAMAWPLRDSTLKLLVLAGKIRKATTVISLLHDWKRKKITGRYLPCSVWYAQVLFMSEWSLLQSPENTAMVKLCVRWHQVIVHHTCDCSARLLSSKPLKSTSFLVKYAPFSQNKSTMPSATTGLLAKFFF